MASDRTQSNPHAELPEVGGEVRPLRDQEVPNTLAIRLTPVVDRIRQLNTRFGIRPYRVYLVHVQWSGGVNGAGSPTELSRREIVPTPRIENLGSTSEILRSTGLSEEGGITLSEISTKYSEDDLMGRTPDLLDPVQPRTSLRDIEFYWEVQENRTLEPRSVRRRYVPNAAPSLSRDSFQWTVSLTRQDAEGDRNTGSLQPRTRF